MKKYYTPKIEIMRFEANDIIQTSGEVNKETLNTAGVFLGSASSTDIFK